MCERHGLLRYLLIQILSAQQHVIAITDVWQETGDTYSTLEAVQLCE